MERPEGLEKMSEVLREFVKPYNKYTDSLQSYQNLVGIATLGWNLALLPEDKRNDLMNLPNGEGPLLESREANSVMKFMLKQFITRKLTYFPEDKRQIADFQIKDLGDEY